MFRLKPGKKKKLKTQKCDSRPISQQFQAFVLLYEVFKRRPVALISSRHIFRNVRFCSKIKTVLMFGNTRKAKGTSSDVRSGVVL